MTGLMICGAADWELAPLIDALEFRREQREYAWSYWLGAIGDERVIVARTDWGPVNAVGAVICGIRAFEPAAVISQGMAGAHSPELKVGDVVVGERTVDLSAYKSEPAGVGQGVSLDRRVPLWHRIRAGGAELVEHRGFLCDPGMSEALMRVENRYGSVRKGTLGSAYQYNREIDAITALRRLYGSDCEDMESAFSHGAAAAMGVKFGAVRLVSNSEFNDRSLQKEAGRWCAEFVLRAVRTGSLIRK